MALNRANKEPNSVLLTPYITMDNQVIQLGSSTTILTTPNLTLNPSSGYIALNTANTQRMIIDSLGNIGVGSSSSTAKLNVSSSTSQVLLNLTNTTNANWVQATMTRVDNSNQQVAWVYYPAGFLSGNNPYWSTGINAGSANFSINSYDGTALTPRLSIDISGAITGLVAAGSGTGLVAANSAAIGYMGTPQGTNPGSFTLSYAENGKQLYYTTTGQTVTIPANASVPLPLGFTCVIANASGVTTTIAITTDNLYIAGLGTGGAGLSRTLASFGLATLTKVASNIWYITGTGVA